MQNTPLEKSIHNIYDIGIKVKELYNIIEENDGEVDDEQYSQLHFEKSEIKKVGCDILSLRNIIDSQSDMIVDEITRLLELKAKKDKQIVNIEKALMWVLLNFGEQDKKGIWRLDLDIAQLSTRKNPESIVIEDEALVPNEYKKFDFLIKDLTIKQLEQIKELLYSEEYPPIENLSKDNIKETQKVSKKELKPKLVELEHDRDMLLDTKQLLEESFEKELVTKDYYDNASQELQEKIDMLPDYRAYIKEGALNLVIK